MAKLKVLVVDDEVNIRTLLSGGLVMNGHEAVTAADGKEGYEKARSERPDIILLDVKMPVMDGWEACRLIRSDPDLQRTPIIILTAYGQAADCQKSIEAGANMFITKPFNIQLVISSIYKLLNIS